MTDTPYQALTIDTLPARLGGIGVLTGRIGPAASWKAREVGDGNLNLVFIVEGERGSIIVKQALPYVRLVGESWPLPLKRSFFEYHALVRQEARAGKGTVPEVYHYDETQALIVMEYLHPHVILRRSLIQGRITPKIAKDIGLFMARTLFRGSDFSMTARERKADLALFADNVELCDITENLVFTDPYFEAPLNRHTSPELDGIVAELRADRDLKVEAQALKHLFAAKAETLLHGDLHSGSVMVTETDTRVIDPEFAFYGPMAFDVGMLLANYWMAFFAARGHEGEAPRDEMRAWLLTVVVETWQTFQEEFSRLWRTDRKGMLYASSVFEDRGDPLAAEQALQRVLGDVFTDMLGFAGVEMHRRILGLAHNADFEEIEDQRLRGECETRALKLGRHLAVNRRNIRSLGEINALARRLDEGAVA